MPERVRGPLGGGRELGEAESLGASAGAWITF